MELVGFFNWLQGGGGGITIRPEHFGLIAAVVANLIGLVWGASSLKSRVDQLVKRVKQNREDLDTNEEAIKDLQKRVYLLETFFRVLVSGGDTDLESLKALAQFSASED